MSYSKADDDRLTTLVLTASQKMRNLATNPIQLEQLKEYQKLLSYTACCCQQIVKYPETSELEIQKLCEFLQGKLEVLEEQIPVTKARLYHNKDEAKVASSPPIVTGAKALLRPDSWEKDSSGLALFQHKAKNNNNNFIEHYISSPGDITLLPWKEAKEIINKFGFTSAKLHLLFAAHAVDQEKPWESRFSLKASDIAKDLGWDNHKMKSEQLLEIARTAFALDCLLVRTVWVEGRNQKGGIDASVPVGRMWNVVIDSRGQMNFEGRVEDPTEIYLTIQPGGWTQHFLNKAGNKSREALYQFGYMSKQVLKLSGSSHNELALRLAIYLTLESRCHLSGEYRVKTLLNAVLPCSEVEAARSDRRKGYDLKQRWDSSIKLLNDIGWNIYYDDQTYPEWLKPKWLKTENNERLPKGYLDRMLDAKITIKPVNTIQQKLAKLKKQSKPRSLQPPSIGLTGSAIKHARQAKGWTQCKLAGTLGVSKQMVSQIELGRRSATLPRINHIKQVLDIH